MEKNREVLARAAIVKTLTQFDMLIDYVKFYIGDEVLTDGSGNVRRMMKYDFVESTSADIKYISERTFRLYFASSDGLQLAEEDVNIHYLESASLASVIMESLITGPLSANLNRTFPADTKLNNVEVKEKICYVDMNQRFLESMDNISFKVKVYSVVNSLCDLEDIEGVQILIDGNIWDNGDEEVDLTQVLHEDLSMVPKAADVPPVVEKTSIE